MKFPDLAAEIQRTIDIVGVTSTARALHVSIPKLRRMVESQEFDDSTIELSRTLKLLKGE